jgi:hypothetical protein
MRPAKFRGGVIAVAACAAAVCALSLPVAVSSASERVADGSFDSSTCSSSGCSSQSWFQLGYDIGPICSGAVNHCGDGGSGYTSSPVWARLGYAPDFGGSNESYVHQPVAIPASPATLAFNLRIVNPGASPGTFSVTVDGSEVFHATNGTAGYAGYARVSLDVSQFAGPGTHQLKFDGQDLILSSGASVSFDVDDVSLDAPDPASASTGTPQTPSSTAKKCKKRKHRSAVVAKKCRK